MACGAFGYSGQSWPAPPARPSGLTTQPVLFAQRLERIRSGAHNPNQPAGTPFRHGSGAGFNSPASYPGSRRRQRGERSASPDGRRPPPPFAGRSEPSGPMEENDWLDALRNVQNTLATVERIQRDHAAHISTHDRKLEYLNTLTETHENSIGEIVSQVERHRVWIDETFPAREKAYVPQDLFEQLRIQALQLEQRIESLVSFVHQTSRNEAEAQMGAAAPTRAPDASAASLGPVGHLFEHHSPLRPMSGEANQPAAAVPQSSHDEPLQAASPLPSPVAASGAVPASVFRMSPGGPPTTDATPIQDPLQNPMNDAWGRVRFQQPPAAADMRATVDRPSQPYGFVNSAQHCAGQGVPSSWNTYAAQGASAPSPDRNQAPSWNPFTSGRFPQQGGPAYHPSQGGNGSSHQPPQQPSSAPCPMHAQAMPGPATHFGHMGQYMGDQKAMHRKSDSLRKFNGQPEGFAAWTGHMTDHMGKVHPYWRQVLNWLSSTNKPLDFASLHGVVIGPFDESALDLTVKFEQVIVDWLPEKYYLRRAQLAGGKNEEGNGFAVWRRLHREFRGEGQIIDYAGTQCLREYGRCKKLSDVSHHIDGWYELFDDYGKELEHAHHMTRGMFLDIIPTELRSEILKEPKLHAAGHRDLADWCRNRVIVLTSEQLAEVRKKELTTRGKVTSLRNVASESPLAPDLSEAPDWAKHLFAMNASPSIAAVQAPPKKPTGPGARRPSPRRSASPSPGRRASLVPDWGNKCFHCGSDKHTRQDCEKFSKMMSEAACNKGKSKSEWKPPEGYKSAIGRARDAAKLALAKSQPSPKAKAAARKVSPLLADDNEPDIDGSSDSDFSELGDIAALRRVSHVSSDTLASRTLTSRSPPQQISALNRFSPLEESQTYDPEVLAILNSWAHKTRVTVTKKIKSVPYPDVERTAKFIEGRSLPRKTNSLEQPIVIQSQKDLESSSRAIRPLPSGKTAMNKLVKRISNHITLAADEKLVMVDSGAFTHAINAESELPDHELIPIRPNERSPDGESACGVIMKCTGKVRTKGTVEGLGLDVHWNSMPVKVPILSVRKLVKDQHHVRFHEQGGYIKCLRTGARIPFFEYQGVYYLKMRFLPPTSKPADSLFSRPVP